MRTIALLALALAAPSSHASDLHAAPQTDGAELVVRAYDVRLAAPSHVEGNLMETLLPVIGDTPHGSGQGVLEEVSDGEDVAALVLELFPEEFQYEGRSLYLADDHRLVIQGPAALHDRVRDLLAFLEQRGRQTITVRVDSVRLEDAAGALPATLALTPAQADALRARGSVSSQTLRVQPAGIAQVDATREISVLREWKTEIAQGSAVMYPKPAIVTGGDRLGVHALTTPAGVLLTLLLRRAELVGVDDSELEMRLFIGSEQGSGKEYFHRLPIEHLTARNGSLFFQTLVRPGEVLALPSRWDLASGQGAEVLLLEVESEPFSAVATHAAGNGRELDVWQTPWATTGRELNSEFGPLGDSLRSDVGPSEELQLALGISMRAGDDLYELDFPGADAVYFAGGRCFVLRPAGVPRPAADSFAAIAPPDERMQLDLRLIAGGAGPHEVAAIALPLVSGEFGYGVVGFESTMTARVDPEVAQFAYSAEVEPHHVFDGMLVKARPERRLDGGWSVELIVRARLLDELPESVDVQAPVADQLERASFRHLLLSERLEFGPDDPTGVVVLGDTALALPGSLALEVRVR